MNRRARLWNDLLAREDIPRSSRRELTFIKSSFAGIKKLATFRPYLSKGFPPKHEEALKALFKEDYDPAVWLVKAGLGVDPRERALTAHWITSPIVDMEGFCENLRLIYAGASRYSYLRVGGVASGNRTPVGDVDERGLLKLPKRRGVRMTYLTPVWERVAEGDLCGTSVHVFKSIDRLVELWAVVELLRRHDKLEKNSVYLMEFDDLGRPRIEPTMGVRTVDGDKVLLSLMPTPGEDVPPYSDWMQSIRLAEFAEQAVTRIRMPPARNLSVLMPGPVEEAMQQAFEALLKSGIDCSRNYGPLDSFDNVRIMKDRMIDWPNDLWLPPLG